MKILEKIDKYLIEKEAREGVTTEAEATHKEHYHDNHHHKYEVDENGDGETTETVNGEDHIHKIVDWDVKETHNHTHELNTHHEDY